MRRPLLALTLLLGTLGVASQQASTAANDLPTQTTAVHRATSVTGATLVSLDYTMSGGSITAVSPRLRGALLLKVVRVRFGTGTPVVCTSGVVSVLNVLTGLREATYTCGGLLEDADRPRPLAITVS